MRVAHTHRLTSHAPTLESKYEDAGSLTYSSSGTAEDDSAEEGKGPFFLSISLRENFPFSFPKKVLGKRAATSLHCLGSPPLLLCTFSAGMILGVERFTRPFNKRQQQKRKSRMVQASTGGCQCHHFV